MRKELTKRQRQIYVFIRWFSERKGYAPSLRQIGMAVKIGTANGVKCHVDALQRKGYLRRDPKVPRGMRLLDVPSVPMLRIVGGEDYEVIEPVATAAGS